MPVLQSARPILLSTLQNLLLRRSRQEERGQVSFCISIFKQNLLDEKCVEIKLKLSQVGINNSDKKFLNENQTKALQCFCVLLPIYGTGSV